MKIGIVGQPQSGKTTLFCLLTKEEKHKVATAELPDGRLNILREIFNPPKVTPIHITFVDGTSKGELEGMDGLIYVFRPNLSKEADVKECLGVRPGIVVVNIDEEDLGKGKYKTIGMEVCAKDEWELFSLPENERAAFMQELGVREPKREHIIAGAFAASNWISFFTYAGEKELRAWPIPRGTKAKEAAGRVHKDMERGFIRAEVVHFSDLEGTRSIHKAKSDGHLRTEGKDYEVQDGDIVTFRFSV